MAEQAIALVVRGTDWSETSRITTLWTREFGKIRALAKGGRRLRSNFEISFDLLSVCRIVFLRKAHSGLDLLTEAQLVEQFPELRHNLPRLYAGYYIAELLADGTEDYDPHPKLFDFALATLRSLGHSDSLSTWTKLSEFELVWLSELGYSPRLDACTVCAILPEIDEELPSDWSFSPEIGGIVCPHCSRTARDRRRLSSAVWRSLRELLTAPNNEVVWEPDHRREMRQILGQLVSYTLGRRPKMLAYLNPDGSPNGSK